MLVLYNSAMRKHSAFNAWGVEGIGNAAKRVSNVLGCDSGLGAEWFADTGGGSDWGSVLGVAGEKLWQAANRLHIISGSRRKRWWGIRWVQNKGGVGSLQD